MVLLAVLTLTPVSHKGGAFESMRGVRIVSKDCKARVILKPEKQATQ